LARSYFAFGAPLVDCGLATFAATAAAGAIAVPKDFCGAIALCTPITFCGGTAD
jgi:hypothetical protein